MWKYLKWFGLSHAQKVPPVLYKVCRQTKFFVTLSWIWNKVKVKMKGMLHIYNDCTIDWHQVCENMWSGLGWVAHTKYHPSYIKYAGKLSFCDLFLNLKWGQGQNERYIASSVCKYVKRFGPSHAHEVPLLFGTNARTHAQTHAQTHARTHARSWILCHRFGAFAPQGTTSWPVGSRVPRRPNFFGIHVQLWACNLWHVETGIISIHCDLEQ